MAPNKQKFAPHLSSKTGHFCDVRVPNMGKAVYKPAYRSSLSHMLAPAANEDPKRSNTCALELAHVHAKGVPVRLAVVELA